ncbi:MAG: ribonuclease M5 [Eubacteriales bacterium]|nr:ribonuclease M5 [Eubacteriales bacterium]
MAEKEKIKEVIVVEGRDDTARVTQAVNVDTIETHGFGMAPSMWKEIDKAYEERGIIILTDPDHAGSLIRKKLKERYPEAKEAFMPREEARRGNNIGVENASAESIRKALAKVKTPASAPAELYTMEDLEEAGLTGGPGSRERRAALADALGIAYGNAKALLNKLNGYQIKREEYYGALRSISDQSDQK